MADSKLEVKHRLPVRKLFAASVGNALEWFDWTIYATFSIYFATAFFPSGNETLAQINTFATYALAFFRPLLGSLLLGRFADVRTPFAVKTRHAGDVDVFLALSVGTALFVLLQYPFGTLSDRIGRKT